MLRIPHVYPGACILSISFLDATKTKEEGGEKLYLLSCFFCGDKFHKIVNYFIFEQGGTENNLSQSMQNLSFLAQKIAIKPSKYGLGSRDRAQTYPGFGPGVKKAPDPHPQDWENDVKKNSTIKNRET